MITLKIGRKSFTLIEILIAVVILTIIATLSLAGYTRATESANAMTCQNNLLFINTAIELYGAENLDALPTSLSSVWPAYKDKVFAKLKIDFERKGWFGIREQYAYAAVLDPLYYGNNISAITCPSDPTPPSKGGVSYAINPAFVKLDDLYDITKADLTFVGDSDSVEFTGLTYRHKSWLIEKDTAYEISGNGVVYKTKKNGVKIPKIKAPKAPKTPKTPKSPKPPKPPKEPKEPKP